MAYSVQEARDGGYIVAGVTRSFGAGENDVWVLKLRPDGTVDWQKTYGGDNVDFAYSIQETRNGGYIVAGRTQFGIGWQKIWVLKLRADGSIEWQKIYGGDDDLAESIQQTSDGGYIVAGWTQPSDDARSQDIWVLKLGPDGTVEWQKTYGGGSSDRANSIQQTVDGGYVVAGSTSSFGTRGALWVLKLTPDGSFGYAQDKSIDPSSCNFIKDTSVSGKDSSATVKVPSIHSINSDAYPRDSEATVLDTNASVEILCP